MGKPNRILISGLGPAGCIFALRLKQLGQSSFLALDSRRPEDTSRGAGFILQENGLTAIKQVGLEQELLKNGVLIKKYFALKMNGDIEMADDLKQPLLGLKRADLIHTLLKDIPESNLVYSMSIKNFESDFKPSFTVVAEGIGSPSRKALYPEIDLVDSRYLEIVGLSYHPQLAQKWSGEFRRFRNREDRIAFGSFPVNSEQLVWYFRAPAVPSGRASFKGDQHWALAQAGNFSTEVKEVIQASDPKNVTCWYPTMLNALPQPFVDPDIFLIGDAAHPLLSFTSQGVSLSLQDAVELANLFGKGVPTPQALSELSEQCLKRANRYCETGSEALVRYLSQSDRTIWR